MSGERTPSHRRQESPYFGSILFFKHLIFATVILLILIPTALAICLRVQNGTLHRELARQQARIEALEAAQPPEEETPPPETEPEAPQPEAIPPETPAYVELYPDLYAPAAALGAEDIDKSVYLTFDDGPSERTDEILRILENYGVKATFFVIGTESEEGLERMRAITAAGHTLAVHSYTHSYQKIYASVEEYLADFYAMYCQILEATGTAPRVFRFPGGSINGYNGGVYRDIIAEMTRRGFVYFDWNVSSGDAAGTKTQSAAVLAANSLKGTTARRAIVLMHDSASKTTTVESLPAVIEGYQAAGFTFHPLTAETRSITFGYRD